MDARAGSSRVAAPMRPVAEVKRNARKSTNRMKVGTVSRSGCASTSEMTSSFVHFTFFFEPLGPEPLRIADWGCVMAAGRRC